MTRLATFAGMVLLAVIIPQPAIAANFEVTPFGGYTWGGQFSDSVTGTALKVDETANYGVMVDFKQDEQTQIELYFSRQNTQLKADNGLFTGNPLFDLDIEYYHVGGTYSPNPNPGKTRPFVVGTLGATHMVPKGSGLDALTKFSLSLGGGLKLFATDRVGLRLEGRWFGTLFDGSGSAFCSSGACAVQVQGSLFSQFVANAGLIIAF
jgi:opacity protein-like surface antigen